MFFFSITLINMWKINTMPAIHIYMNMSCSFIIDDICECLQCGMDE